MGLEARTPAVEDDEAASWIAGLIEGRAGDFGPVRARLLDCDGARRLRRLGQHDDLSVCVELDSRELVPVVVAGDPPRAVVVERLPKTRSGKVLRATMRKIADVEAYATPAPIEETEVLSETLEQERCRWCGATGTIELVPRPVAESDEAAGE